MCVCVVLLSTWTKGVTTSTTEALLSSVARGAGGMLATNFSAEPVSSTQLNYNHVHQKTPEGKKGERPQGEKGKKIIKVEKEKKRVGRKRKGIPNGEVVRA